MQTDSVRQAFFSSLSPQEKAALSFRAGGFGQWRGWYARPKQLAPIGDWIIWFLCAGRGFGKSRSGAEWIREQVGPRDVPSNLRVALAARTAADVRDVIVEGQSGILACSAPWNTPKWQPTKRRLTWPNGARATTFSADQPNQFRGPQYHIVWADEVASWRYPEAWDQLRFGNRLPDVTPRFCITTTPRPTDLIKGILAEETTAVTVGSTFENLANLHPSFVAAIFKKYAGTRLGRQELFAQILSDTPGALWKLAQLERDRAKLDRKTLKPIYPELWRIVVAVDPAVTSGEESDETGIVVIGIDASGEGWVLEDLSGRHTPHEWATLTVKAYNFWEADLIVGEVNNGGDLVESNVRTVDNSVAFHAVHAAKGKYTRAEPVSALYEQHRVHHVGVFAELEGEMTSWIPGNAKSPSRLDALVWGATELMLGGVQGGGILIINSGRS